jgi:hypothetical protein
MNDLIGALVPGHVDEENAFLIPFFRDLGWTFSIPRTIADKNGRPWFDRNGEYPLIYTGVHNIDDDYELFVWKINGRGSKCVVNYPLSDPGCFDKIKQWLAWV